MSAQSIAQDHTITAHLAAHEVEQLALRLAITRGLVMPDGHLSTLPIEEQRHLREDARERLRLLASDRTFADGELWARDSYASHRFRKTFNACTPEQQRQVVETVQHVTVAIQFYLAGYCEPMNPYTRAQVQMGAAQTPLVSFFDRLMITPTRKAPTGTVQ